VEASRGTKPTTIAHGWDRSSPLIGRQLNAISALAKHMANRLTPQHIMAETDGLARGVGSGGNYKNDQAASMPDVHSTHEFHQWYTELDARKKIEQDEKFRCHAEVLKHHLTTCDSMLQKADETQAHFEDMRVKYRSVKGRGQALQVECARLVSEKKKLLEFAEVLHRKLGYFDELEVITQTFQSGRSRVDGDDFVPLLHRLDECLSFIHSRPQYAEYAAYALRCGQLRSRALSAVRSHVFATLRSAVAQVRRHVRDDHSTSVVPADGSGDDQRAVTEGALTSVFYIKFRAAVSCLRPIMDEMESRSRLGVSSESRREYAQVMADCRAIYCEQRLALIVGFVQKRLIEYAARHPLLGFIRTGCAYLLQVCRAERELFECALPLESDAASALWTLMEPLGAILHDAVRPQYILLNDIYILAELVDVLAGEVLEEQLGRHGDAGASMRPFVETVLADVRERLIFRAQTFIKEEVDNYRPTAEDLDYPGKLERMAATSANSAGNAGTSPVAITAGDEGVANVDTDFEGHGAAATKLVSKSIHRWFPPLEHTLSCLATLYRCLDSRTFSGLAQEAVQMCSDSILSGSRTITRQSANLDGQLFAIKHLLVLREQIAPFESDLAAHCIPVRELDFSHLRGQMRRMLAGELSLFSTSPDANALIVIAAKGAPRVVESTIDSRRELERHLKTACETYIMTVTRRVVEPMLSFLTKVTAVRVSGTLPRDSPVCTAAFAAPDRLAEIVTRVNEALMSDLPKCVQKMALYLTGTATREIIFNPIRSNVVEAHSQIAALLAAEYPPEVAGTIALKSPVELANLLDAMLD